MAKALYIAKNADGATNLFHGKPRMETIYDGKFYFDSDKSASFFLGTDIRVGFSLKRGECKKVKLNLSEIPNNDSSKNNKSKRS